MGIGTLRRYHPKPGTEPVINQPGAPAVVDGSPEVTLDPTPGKSGKKADWEAYALAHGKTQTDIEGLKRDDIAALFPEPAYAPIQVTPEPSMSTEPAAPNPGDPEPAHTEPEQEGQTHPPVEGEQTPEQ